MKLISCQECKDMVVLRRKEIRSCHCGNVAGKYLDDGITAVVNNEAIVVGIDNNGFNIAERNATSDAAQKCSHRVDYFFTGWIPNFPGEVIRVETVDDVLKYDYHISDEDKNYGSTSPAEVSEKNESKSIWNIFKKK